MNRRTFVKKTAAATALSGLAASSGMAFAKDKKESGKFQFQMKYAPHFGMFKNSAGDDLIDQLNFMADQGFRALEDNGMKNRTVEMQEKIAKTMQKHDMEMGVFVANKINWKEPTLTSGKAEHREAFLKDIRESVEVAKRVNAKWMTVVPGHVDMRQDMGYQTAHVMESLKQASAILEPHGLVIVLEPLNFYNHPGLFLTKMAQGYALCKGVDSPSCKILCDLYHQQIQEGNLIPNIDNSYEEIGYFQIGDNPGRKEPTTGEINYKNVFKHIQSKGFTGILGMEHGNFHKGKEGEEKLIAAYKEVDSF
ncbi:MAG: TIM barrel protein [Bacteroidota bacterium]